MDLLFEWGGEGEVVGENSTLSTLMTIMDGPYETCPMMAKPNYTGLLLTFVVAHTYVHI